MTSLSSWSDSQFSSHKGMNQMVVIDVFEPVQGTYGPEGLLVTPQKTRTLTYENWTDSKNQTLTLTRISSVVLSLFLVTWLSQIRTEIVVTSSTGPPSRWRGLKSNEQTFCPLRKPDLLVSGKGQILRTKILRSSKIQRITKDLSRTCSKSMCLSLLSSSSEKFLDVYPVWFESLSKRLN